MSEHEPECWIVSHSNPLNGCICTELRACKQRVLIAAREAVAALDPLCSGLCECLPDALAAIDALRLLAKP